MLSTPLHTLHKIWAGGSSGEDPPGLRLSSYPDMQCTGELNIDSFVGTWRALYCRTDTPKEAVEAMAAAVDRRPWPRLARNRCCS